MMKCLVVLALLAGCNFPVLATAQEAEFLVPVKSAVVELRESPTQEEIERATRVVILGTGTPIPDARRAGSSIAVIHRGESYLFDVGAGAVQNATIARYRYDIPSLYPTQIGHVFITHLHNDHTLDLVEAAYSMWWRRPHKLKTYGPEGMAEMVSGMQQMMAPDIRLRTAGTQPVQYPESQHVVVTEIEPGEVLSKDGLKIEAFNVSHGDIQPAFGYRITTHDRVIVISGDTAFSATVQEMASGADLLLHEAISDTGLSRNSEAFQAYHKRSHTTATDVGRLASIAKPGLLVLYHGLFYGEDEQLILDEVRKVYRGKVVLANDGDIF